MNAPATRKPVVTTDVFGNNLTLNFITGEELVIDVSTLTADIKHQAMLHGLKQKLVDAAAIARNKDTGLSATSEDKYAAVRVVYDRLTGAGGVTPTWNANREGVERQAGGIFLRAMMQLTGKAKEVLEAEFEKMGKEKVAALKKNARVVDVMHELEKAALANRDDDSDDLLDQLAGL